MSDPETDIVECHVVRETDKAYLLRDGETKKESWFPKSEVVFEERNIKTGHAHADIPIWILENKGW